MTTRSPPRGPADRIMPVVAMVLGLAHIVFGVTKLIPVPILVEQFHGWELPPWFMTFTGVAQLLGGIGMLVRDLRLPSSFAMGLVMIGATVTVLATGHEAWNAPLTLALALACFAVAGHRLTQFAREFVADEQHGS